MTPSLIFFGSFQHYSTKVLESLFASSLFKILAVITTPGSPTESWAQAHRLPVFTPEKLDHEALGQLAKPDLFITAGYGKLLPKDWLNFPTIASLNLHFSLLPKYRGANPAEWAILMGEQETGVTLIEMSPNFDTGKIIAQTAIEITPNDNRETVYDKLYDIGGQVLPEMISLYLKDRQAVAQGNSPTPYARRFTRKDGFIEWSAIIAALAGKATQEDLAAIERKSRAFYGYPSLWTLVPTQKGAKRMQILACHLQDGRLIIDMVHIEGYQQAAFNQIKNLISL